MASSTLSASSLLNARAPVASRRSARPPAARALRVFASQDKKERSQAPKDAMLKTFGAIAAAQLALSGAALADIIPDSAKSSSARDAINERTSNLPTFGDVGRALNKNFGQTDPKGIGRAIDANTPDAPDLTKNPKDIGKDIKRGVERAVGDLSLVNDKDIGQAGKNIARDAKSATKNLGNDISSKLPGQDAGAKLASKAKNLANTADKKAKNIAGDLSDLPEIPNPFKGSADPENVAKDAKNKAQSLGSDIGSKLPNSSDLPDLGDAKRAAGDAKRAIESNIPSSPGNLNIPKNS